MTRATNLIQQVTRSRSGRPSFLHSRSETALRSSPCEADRRAQEETATSTLASVRPTILDYPALCLVPVDRSPGSGETGDGRRLAPCWISALLEVAITSTCWPTENYRRNSGPHPPPGRRECDLGSTQDPWRTSEAGLRYLRANRSPVSATCWAPR